MTIETRRNEKEKGESARRTIRQLIQQIVTVNVIKRGSPINDDVIKIENGEREIVVVGEEWRTTDASPEQQWGQQQPTTTTEEANLQHLFETGQEENGIIDICDGLVVPKSNPNKPSKDRSKKPVVKKTEFSLNPYKKAELEKRKLAAKGGGVGGGTVGGAVGGSGSTTTSVRTQPATPITEKKQKVKTSSGQQNTGSGSGGNSKCTLRVQSTGVRTNYPGVSSTDPNRYQQQRIQQYGVSPPYGKPPASKKDEYHQRAMKAAMARGRNGRHLTKKASRLLDSDEEDYDPEMDDFIDDEGDSTGVNISNEISKIFKYDRTRYDTAQEEYECSRMDVGFHEIEREEQRSTRIARREDAEAAREEEKQRRSELERKRKRQL